MQGASVHNNTDGSSYFVVRDNPVSPPAPSVAYPDLAALYKDAAAKNFTRAQWIAASNTKADASTWRKVMSWPFGDKGGVFKFNKEGTGVYATTSTGRWARAGVRSQHGVRLDLGANPAPSFACSFWGLPRACSHLWQPPTPLPRDTTEVQLISLQPGAKVLKRIASNPLVNVGSILFDDDTWEPLMVAFNCARGRMPALLWAGYSCLIATMGLPLDVRSVCVCAQAPCFTPTAMSKPPLLARSIPARVPDLRANWTVLDSSIAKDWEKIVTLRPGESSTIADYTDDKKTWILITSGAGDEPARSMGPGGWEAPRCGESA